MAKWTGLTAGGRPRRGFFPIAAAVVAMACCPMPARGQVAGWFDKDWPVRRLVTVDARPTPQAPGDEIGVAELLTDNLAARDGADIRVANASGRALPMRLLQVGPGSFARVAFAVQPGRNSYAIYYGQPKAPPPGKELELTVRRGLLLETCTFGGGNINSHDGVLAAFKRVYGTGRPGTPAIQGADFVGNVFHGNNLFGPSGRTISRYSGLLHIPATGAYGFATSSDDASFLLIDGKAVVEWGGYHGWVADARHNKTITLTAGIHEFEYLHVNVASDGGAVAAWKPPGADRWVPIPPGAFLPVFRATPGGRERFGTRLAAELTVQHVGEALVGDDEYVQRYRLTSQPTGFDAKVATFAWDFGDGTGLAGVGLNDVEHVYLTDGPVEIAVTVTQGTLRESVSNQVVVSRHWPTIVGSRPDPPGVHGKLVQRYEFAKMSPRAVARAMELFKRAKAPQLYMAAAHALVAAAGPVDDRILTQRMGEYAEFLMEQNQAEGPTAAVNEYLTAAERATSPFAKAAMYVGAGRILLDRLGNDPKAEQMFAAALKFKDRGNDRSIKAAWIGTGDVHRRRGDGEKALQAYKAAEQINPPASPNQAAVEVGSLARSIEYYIRQGDFETARKHLADWDWQFPTNRLDGYSTMLWVRFYQAQNMHRQAIQEASDLVAASERSNYAPALLLAAADSWLALKDAGRARKLLEHVAAVYPDSPLVADAKKKLKGLGG